MKIMSFVLAHFNVHHAKNYFLSIHGQVGEKN